MYLLRDELSYACVSMGNAIDLMTNTTTTTTNET